MTGGSDGNDLVNSLLKAAAVEGLVVYDKMPIEVIITREKENLVHMWLRQWTDIEMWAVTKVEGAVTNGEGAVTKAFLQSGIGYDRKFFYSYSLQQW